MSKRPFRVGDRVVYPHHGAATIEGLQDREVDGSSRKYYVLRLSYGDLTLMVPTDGADEVGLRGVVPKDEVEQVFQVLKSRKQAPSPSNWSRRFKNHVEKLRSGDIYQVAEVSRISRFVTRTKASLRARSACWPKHARSWCPS